MASVTVIPKYKNDPSPDDVKILVGLLREALPDHSVTIKDPVEPRGHEATFWEVVQIIFSDASNTVTLAGAATLAVKKYLKRRQRDDKAKRPKSVHLLGPANEEIAEIVVESDTDEPHETGNGEDKH